ncbi:MBL fold metallo-hydrolase [Rhodohalobacter mucosus]|uniref:MBL fold metallo-hydrolase n=1 Tax=Rhodohalobacter mucosus TaxID=2079485 RepID=A0A316TS09_9BACT|nr:MBL fold metallo-hydrolase [Rhodohalobacter mucosus]PWN07337.1 MBL fold metallo-hydrolase [Rhodohalobacter mucosus]
MKPLILEHLELYPIESGRFMLDGGAMFGVVPKTLWSRQIPADDKNRIPMAMRCLLVKSMNTGRIYLVDNGSGNKFSEKMIGIYGLDYEHSDLISSLGQAGVQPEEVTDMVFSHLHFDHCGGTTEYDESGNLTEVFPNARYHVNKRHWETANHPNAREKASFFAENLEPIEKSGRLNLVNDRHTFEDGFTTLPMDGHTIGQQLPVLSDSKRTVIFAADLLPTFAHVPLPWVMGYDMVPVQTLEEKEAFLDEAVEKGWFLFLEHDASNEVITVKKEDRKFSMDRSLTLADIE